MSTFAIELAKRLTGQPVFWEYLGRLHGAGVGKTLSRSLAYSPQSLGPIEVTKLLYCAGVFTQTQSDKHKALAQTIALSALLVDGEDGSYREKCLQVLTELGNFPGLKYAEGHFGAAEESLLGLVNRRVSESLNTVAFANGSLPLTDYQKGVWDALPGARALVVSAPTSAGKSFLVVEHLCRQAESGKPFTAVYIAPTRALLSEVYQKVHARLEGKEGIRISTVPSLDADNSQCQIFILTQERLHVLLSISNHRFDLVVVDEAQNLSDAARGMILHDCLETVVARNPDAQVVLLAPGAEGLPDIARKIGLRDVVSEATSVSPVQQNRIVVSKVKSLDEMDLKLLLEGGRSADLGRVKSSRGLGLEQTRLAAVALELGGDDGSLVYATGPANAEDVGALLMHGLELVADVSLNDLATFVQEHIHPEYRLASMIRHGVAFHYGRMPSLLREALEDSFKARGHGLKYLVCTTTLFQGVNLPARNVFIDTPMRGRSAKLDPAALWNFAGRAGRLNNDIAGNVFLVDYEDWGVRPLDEPVRYQVTSAISDVLTSSTARVLAALNGDMPVVTPASDEPAKVRACAGLLIAKAAQGSVRAFIQRLVPEANLLEFEAIATAADVAVERVGLPPELLEANWTIDPFGLRRLFDKMLRKIDEGAVDDLIPLNPHEAEHKHYASLFIRILREVYGQNNRFGALVATLAIPWMRGVPYPVILKNWIASTRRREDKASKAFEEASHQTSSIRRRKAKAATVDKLIREAFALIEDTVRFQFVQLGKAYIDLLALALRTRGLAEKVSEIFDFSLALELGVSTKTSTSFIELGLSRISAATLEGLFPDSALSTKGARAALEKLDVVASNLSPIIVAELHRLRLVGERGALPAS